MAGLGLFSGLGEAFANARQTSPELFQALGAGLLSGDLAGGFSQGYNTRDRRLVREQDASQFDRRLAQDQMQSDRSYGLQAQELGLRQQAMTSEAQERRAQRNATRAWAEQTGDPEIIGLVNGGLFTQAFQLHNARKNPNIDLQEVYDDQGRKQKGYFSGGQFVPVGGAAAAAGAGAFDLTMPDGTRISMGQKPPSGFMPDPNDPSRLTPIPGGPGDQIPGELAARIGLADDFLKRAPNLRAKIANGDVTGWVDRFKAGNASSSDQAGVYRDLQSGTDALMRLLTGAGMNDTEARQYAERYLPSYGDDAASAAQKLDTLTRELNATREMALRGRGGAPQAQTPGTYKSKYGLR